MDVEPRTEHEDARGVGSAPGMLGRYRIVAELGRGSTSIVYLAIVSSPGGFHKLFALKQLRPSFATDPALVARFVAEARIGARLDHPNVVQTLEIEEQEALPYIVMEYLDGQTLHRVASAARLAFAPMPLHMHLAVLSGAIEGLGYAHAAHGYDGAPLRVVHRDVSPHNIFVTCSGQSKILDFGMAQAVDSAIDATVDGGRAAYMSPEQAAGESVDARSDLFAIGIMMWEAVTRRRFWPEGSTDIQILSRLTAGNLPESRASALANAPADLQSMIAKATSLDPADRYESAAAFQADLQVTLQRATPVAFNLRDLGHRVAGLFASDRARLQAAVDGQAEIARTAMAGDPPRRATVRTEAASRSTPPPPPVSIDSVDEPEPPPAASPSSPDPTVAAPPAGPLASYPLPQYPLPQTEEAGWTSPQRVLTIGAIALSLAAIVAISVSRSHAVESVPGSPVASLSAASLAPPDPGTAGAPAVPSPPVEEPSAPVAAAASDTPSAKIEARAMARVADPPATHSRPLSTPTPGRPAAPVPWHPVAKPPPGFVAASPPPVAPSPASGRPGSAAIPGQPPAGVQPSRPIDNLNPYGP
jgi:eukaryotic-like serine/threonine-protein kinase